MSPDEVIQKLKMMGVDSSRATLLRYKEAGLIPKPEEGAGGRGVGRFSDYPGDTVFEYFASHYIVKSKHATFEQAAEARRVVQEFRASTGFFGGHDWSEFDKFYALIRDKYFAKYSERVNLKENRYKEFADAERHTSECGYNSFERLNKVHQTAFAVEWWELLQVASSKIDNSYIEYCKRIDRRSSDYIYRGDPSAIDSKIFNLAEQLRKVASDIEKLINERQDTGGGEYPPLESHLHPLGRWIALHKLYPDLQLAVRNAMLIDYRNISPITLDFLVTGKLPEV